MKILFVVALWALCISSIHAYQTHFPITPLRSSSTKLDNRLGIRQRKSLPFQFLTIKATSTSTLRTLLPISTPSPLFQATFPDECITSNRKVPLVIHPLKQHDRKRIISNVLSSLVRFPPFAWIHSLFQRRRPLLQNFQRKILLPILLGLLLVLSGISEAWAVGAGRAGGSFGKSSSSSSYSRPSISRPAPQYRPSAPIVTIVRPPSQYYYNNGSPYDGRPSSSSSSVVEVSEGFSVSEVVLLTWFGLVMANGFLNNDRRDNQENGSTKNSVLGPGVTVATLTVALNIPNRQDPNNILNKIRRLSESARTDTRKGVQDLMASVAMELLRQERSIISVRTVSQHVKQLPEAQRIFNQISTRERSKFDRESFNRFGGVDLSDPSMSGSISPGANAPTLAIVTLTISIEGDKTMLPIVKTRAQLRDALSRIASDVQVDDCLLAGEVLWAPEGNNEMLTQEEIMADYPDLLTIL